MVNLSYRNVGLILILGRERYHIIWPLQMTLKTSKVFTIILNMSEYAQMVDIFIN